MSKHQLVADSEDGRPYLRLRCPACGAAIEQSYAISHGEKLQCVSCTEWILVTVRLESVHP